MRYDISPSRYIYNIAKRERIITTMSRTHSQNNEPTGIMERFRKSRVTMAVALGAGSTALVGCAQSSPEVPAKPVASETAQAKNMFEQVAYNVENRPQPGSPEYEALQTERYVIPYVEGQPAEEVVDRLAQSLLNWTEAGLVDGPKNEAESLDWVLNADGQSRNDLIAALDLPYHDRMAASGLIGPEYDSTDFGRSAVVSFGEVHSSRILGIYSGAIDPNNGIEVLDAGISDANQNKIVGTMSFDSGIESSISYTLTAEDVDGDSTPDVWRFS